MPRTEPSGEKAAQYEFDVRVVDIDREGYYYPRWDRATPMTITAPTRQDAINQADALMGEAPRGRYWGVKVDRVRSASIPPVSTEEYTNE